MQPFVTNFTQRLAAAQTPDGGWSYAAAGRPYTEPTALAAMAFAAHDPKHPAIAPALQWLTKAQTPDGSLGLTPDDPIPPWPTALAALAWRWAAPNPNAFQQPLMQAVKWLMTFEGIPLPQSPITGHDTTLIGWPWVEGTHSWIEPTAYAVLTAKSFGQGNHPRIREAVTLILDRAVETGGWNYGNNRVLMNQLRPFPACTGLALLALGGEPESEQSKNAINYLTTEVARIRSPMSLAFSLMALIAWNQRPEIAPQALLESATKVAARPARPADLAYLLLAAAERNSPFVRAAQTAPVKP
jgi:hypothetical protein